MTRTCFGLRTLGVSCWRLSWNKRRRSAAACATMPFAAAGEDRGGGRQSERYCSYSGFEINQNPICSIDGSRMTTSTPVDLGYATPIPDEVKANAVHVVRGAHKATHALYRNQKLEVAPFDLRRHSSQVQGPGRLEEMAVTAAAQQASQPVQNCCMNKNTIEDVFVSSILQCAPVNVVTEEDALAEAALFGGFPVADAQVQRVVHLLRPHSRPRDSAVNMPPYSTQGI